MLPESEWRAKPGLRKVSRQKSRTIFCLTLMVAACSKLGAKFAGLYAGSDRVMWFLSCGELVV